MKIDTAFSISLVTEWNGTIRVPLKYGIVWPTALGNFEHVLFNSDKYFNFCLQADAKIESYLLLAIANNSTS